MPVGDASELAADGGVTGRWLRSIVCGLWQIEHIESSGCTPTGWAMSLVVLPAIASRSVTPPPVLKLMPSWHEPQALALGAICQLLPCAVFTAPGLTVSVLPPSWHLVQLRTSCG